MPTLIDVVRELSDSILTADDLTNPTPTDEARQRAAAFVVLAHAELEFAVEEACNLLADSIASSHEPVTAIVAWGFLQAKVRSNPNIVPARTPLTELATHYKEHATGLNNGITLNSLHNMMVPLGIDFAPLSTDVATLDAFGRARGELAHLPLRMWKMTDSPSTLKAKALQAAASAETITAAVASRSGALTPALPRRTGRVRRWLARKIHEVGWLLERRG